jgi:hypothetical protein
MTFAKLQLDPPIFVQSELISQSAGAFRVPAELAAPAGLQAIAFGERFFCFGG